MFLTHPPAGRRRLIAADGRQLRINRFRRGLLAPLHRVAEDGRLEPHVLPQRPRAPLGTFLSLCGFRETDHCDESYPYQWYSNPSVIPWNHVEPLVRAFDELVSSFVSRTSSGESATPVRPIS